MALSGMVEVVAVASVIFGDVTLANFLTIEPALVPASISLMHFLRSGDFLVKKNASFINICYSRYMFLYDRLYRHFHASINLALQSKQLHNPYHFPF